LLWRNKETERREQLCVQKKHKKALISTIHSCVHTPHILLFWESRSLLCSFFILLLFLFFKEKKTPSLKYVYMRWNASFHSRYHFVIFSLAYSLRIFFSFVWNSLGDIQMWRHIIFRTVLLHDGPWHYNNIEKSNQWWDTTRWWVLKLHSIWAGCSVYLLGCTLPRGLLGLN